MITDRFFFRSSTTDLIGAHMSTRGGLHTAFERAAKIEAAAIALFSKNSSQWKCKPLTDEVLSQFAEARRKASYAGPLLVHTSYLINLAGTNELFYEKSIAAMIEELERAERLGSHAVVLHPGAHVGEGAQKGIDRIARSLDRIHTAIPNCRTITLLETSAGQGSCVGCSFEELGQILRIVDDPSRVGVCFDTCHVFSSGYEIRTREGYEATIEQLDRHVGLRNVGAFHLNDSKRELGSRVDRHQHIGEGHIGLDAFAFLLNDPRFAGIPKVLETPKPDEFEADIRNLSVLRGLVSSGDVVMSSRA